MLSNEKSSISQIQGWVWKSEIPEEHNCSYEEYNYYLLHDKPICQFTEEDLYFMIVQNTCLEHLVPIAITLLSNDLMLEADPFPGDLLTSVLQIKDKKFWLSNSNLYNKLKNVINNSANKIEESDVIEEIKIKIINLINDFMKINS